MSDNYGNLADSSALKQIRVLLVDDHKVMRQGIQHLLELDEAIEVVGGVETGEEALAQARLTSPDVVIMDVRMSGMDGIETTHKMKQIYPDIDVIVLTSYADEYLPEAIQAGASGYLLKSVDYKELSQAIRDVRAGKTVIDRSLDQGRCPRLGDSTQAGKRAVLSDRELEILRLLASGTSTEETAVKLSISTATLKRELRNVFDKLGVDSRTHAITEAYKRGLL